MLNQCCDTPHIFPACGCGMNGNPAVSTQRCIGRRSVRDKYARVHIVSQRYENIASPACALVNGTMFNDLYMPYVPCECECMKEKGCRTT